jgi:hypothetical protein
VQDSIIIGVPEDNSGSLHLHEKGDVLTVTEANRGQNGAARRMPVGKEEDVEYEAEFADEEDLEAVERAHEADARQEDA